MLFDGPTPASQLRQKRSVWFWGVSMVMSGECELPNQYSLAGPNRQRSLSDFAVVQYFV
jgi:hypothetical protein